MILLICGIEEQYKQTNQKQTHRYREHTDGCQSGWGWGMGEKVKGLRSTNWLLQASHGDVKHSVGNIGRSVVITMYCARYYKYLGKYLVKYVII